MTRISAIFIAALALTLVSVGCVEERRGRPQVATSLKTPARTPLPRIPLAPVALTTQADFDALEERLLSRQRPDQLLVIYERLAEGGAPEDDPAIALLLQRWAMLLVDRMDVRADRSRGIELADSLHRSVPESPHTYYLQGYIARKFLISSAGPRALIVNETNVETARVLVNRWQKLLAVAPDYVGPEGHSGSQIAEDIARVSAGLAKRDTHEVPVGIAPALGTKATPVGVKAAVHLDSFEHGSDGERRTVCRERREDQLEGGQSLTELRIDLHCALFEGRGADAITSAQRLIAAGGSLDGCRTILRIAATGSADPEPLARLKRAVCEPR